MITFSNFQFIPNCQQLWHLKNQFFLLLHTAGISLALPLSLLPFTRDTHMVCLQWNISQCVQIWIFNISNADSFTQTIYLWYKYYSKWICVSFSFQYTCLFLMVVWKTEGSRENFVIHEALLWQISRIQSLYLFFFKVFPSWLCNIRSRYTTGRYSE